MAMSGSGWLGAAEVVRAVRLGEMSAEEATEQAIARIERDDAVVNAVVVRDFERARRRAVEVDGLVAAGVGLTLAGLPMTVKESIDVAGLATSWGLAPFADHVAARDAAVVRRLKAAGAIIVGKTNPAAGLGDCQTRNQVYGTTNNPLRSVVSAGGSSGGSAAALAAGLVSAEMGSDLGGSVRIPAAFCGVWGLKPTNDLVSTRGHFFPTTDGAAVPCGVVGPMARSSEDLELLLAVVAEHPLALDALPSRLRVGVLLDGPPVARGVVAALQEVAGRLEGLGHHLDSDAVLPSPSAHLPEYLALLNTATSRGSDGSSSLAGWFDVLDAQARAARAWDDAFDAYDVVLAPVFSTVAFPQDEADLSSRILDVDGSPVACHTQLVWGCLGTYTGHPAVCFPAGKDPSGLPIGLQLIGPRDSDRALIRVAAGIAARDGMD